MTPKPFWQSKTLWYNVLTVIVFVATMFFGYQQNNQLVGQLQVIFTNPVTIGFLNVVLRLITKQPVSLTTPELPTIDTAPPQS